jgi:CRP/FNR family transcriptional regulator, cyclic AMP receptor protein
MGDDCRISWIVVSQARTCMDLPQEPGVPIAPRATNIAARSGDRGTERRQITVAAGLREGSIAMSLVSVDVFKSMSAEELRRLGQGSLRAQPRDGESIFTQGDPADAVYAITAGDGHVRIGTIDRNSKALMVEVFRVGDIFGEIGVIDGGPRSASAVAEGRIELMKIRSVAFLAALANCPMLGEALCRLMAQRLRRTYGLFQDATFETLEVRLARQILYLAGREGRATPQGLRLTHRLRQGDLADLLGATTRSIITILNGWRSREIVNYDVERALLTVRDIPALQAAIESDRR